jgi:hypothetical protein
MKLKDLGFKELIVSRLKKLILDMTSIKFEFVVFVGYGIWAGKIPPIIGLPVIMAALGIREYVDFKQKQNGG